MSKLGGGVELVWFGMSRVKMECEYTRLHIPRYSVNSSILNKRKLNTIGRGGDLVWFITCQNEV